MSPVFFQNFSKNFQYILVKTSSIKIKYTGCKQESGNIPITHERIKLNKEFLHIVKRL